MNLSMEKKSDVLLARINEVQVGADIADELRARIQSDLPESGAQLAIDLSKVDFMSARGWACS